MVSLPSAFVVRNTLLTLLMLKPFTQAFQEYTRSSPLMVLGTYYLRNLYGPLVGWPAPGDTLDNILIWTVGCFVFTCWVKPLQVVAVAGMFFFTFYMYQIGFFCIVTGFPPGAAGMFALASIVLAFLMWTLSAPAKFGFDYNAYKWLVVVWGIYCAGINGYWLSVMETNKVALAPEIANAAKKMAFFLEKEADWPASSDCPTGFKGTCGVIASGIELPPIYPAVALFAAAPLAYLAVAYALSKKVRDEEPNLY